MRIHGTGMNLDSAVASAAAGAEKAAEGARRAEIRKRLMKVGGSDLSPDEAVMVGRWLEGRSGGEQNSYGTSSLGKNSCQG